MANKEYLVNIFGFYRANNMESLPAKPGVLMVFIGAHTGERRCRISQFVRAVAADSIISSATEQSVKSVGSVNPESGGTFYFAYAQYEYDDAVKVAEVLNLKFCGASGPTDIRCPECAGGEALVHVRLDGAVPVIWNDARDFTMSI